MSEKVGSLHYDVSLDTKKMVDEQRRVEAELKKTTKSLDQFGARLTPIASAIGVMSAALAAVKIARLADEIRMLGARVDVAAGSVERGAAAFNELVAISRRTQSSLGGNIEVFNRLNQSILQMGGSQEDTLQTTELLGKAIKVSGASVTEAKAAMLQFGQALGSGKLQGDELRSLMETAPYLMRQLADGIGVPVGALKKLGEEGKLTADVVMNALSKAAEKIDADFKKLPQTFESAMTVAQDQAALAALKFDELTGGSAALAGVTKGLGDVFEELGKQFEGATTEADKLGRNSSVSNWADTTKVALSYLVDAVDLTWQSISVLGRNVKFVFESIGAEIGGLMAASMANAKRDWAGVRAIRQQMKEDSEKRRKELDDADAKTLGKAMLAGERMRQAWAAPQASYSNEGRMPTPTRGPLKSTATADTKGPKFDSAAYLAGLEKATAEGYERINLIEEEALRKNAELLNRGNLGREVAERAATIIQSNAAKARLDLQLKEAGDRYDYLVQSWEKEKALQAAQDAERKQGQELAKGIIGEADPITKLQQELQTKSELLLEAFMRDQGNEALYAQARVALEEQTAAKITEIRQRQVADQSQQQSQQLQAYGNLFGGMADLTKTFAGKQSGIYKAMFAASKAFAIADSIIKIQQGIAGAAALPFPSNIPAIGSVIAATSSIISTISGAQYGGGRQYGGPVAAGSMYRVGEANRPEMFVGDSGRSYMIPGEKGKVVSNSELTSGGSPVIELRIINENPTASVSQRPGHDGRPEIVIGEVARQIRENDGPVWSALRGATNVQGRL